VYAQEAAEIRAAALAFLEMERGLLARGERARWMETELAFGTDGPPGRFDLPDGGGISVRGIVDRVDELPDGTLRVVDYKTGSTWAYRRDPGKGAFNGGRNLQPALYAAAVAQRLGRPVSRFEYRFPTVRGENAIVAYDAAELERARALVAELLAHARDGAFVPTTEKEDCSYCDYAALCRTTSVRRATHTEIDAPLAEWAAANAETLEVYRLMLARRAPQETA
jgi:ATP-dependent helicase/nuclease subunit B